MTRTIVTTTVLSLVLCGCLEFLPEYQETEWYIQPDGKVLVKDYLYDLYSTGSSTSSAFKTFVSIVNTLEPPILAPTPSEDDTNVIIRLRELHDRYGGLNWLQESKVPFEKVIEAYDLGVTSGYYWMGFETNIMTAETNGEVTTHPDVDKGLLVRWPTNTTYIWFKTTFRNDNEKIALVNFWRD